jgi:hypothetical protein
LPFKALPTAHLVLSYMALRRAIGVLGSGLPLLLALGKMLLQGPGLEHSISAYYYTAMGDVLVGSLCAIGVFLLSYQGYERADQIAGRLACVSAVGVALFPVAPAQATAAQLRISLLHHTLAAALFLTLAYFCLVLFRKSHALRTHAGLARRKQHRNRVYSICGYGILLCLALLLLHGLLPPWAALEALAPVFWLEAAAVELFGVSWLVKGQALLADAVNETAP